MSENTTRYREFFKESPEGLAYIATLHDLITTQHEKAEDTDDPQASHAYTQRAKGIREALSLISTLTTEAKKPNNSK